MRFVCRAIEITNEKNVPIDFIKQIVIDNALPLANIIFEFEFVIRDSDGRVRRVQDLFTIRDLTFGAISDVVNEMRWPGTKIKLINCHTMLADIITYVSISVVSVSVRFSYPILAIHSVIIPWFNGEYKCQFSELT